jgi:folylpolyglutamate synthase/dihydropteroate synthase
VHVEHHGRLEYITPNLLIDGAHNEAWFKVLRTYIDSVSSSWQDIIYCFNVKKWKSPRMVLDIFSDIAHHWIWVDAMHDMVEDPEILWNEIDTNEIYYQISTPSELYSLSREYPEKLFVVFGSLYMIGEILQFALYDKNPNSR